MEVVRAYRPGGDQAHADRFFEQLAIKVDQERKDKVAHPFTHLLYVRVVKGIPVNEVVFLKLADNEDYEECCRLYQRTRLM